MFAIQTLFMTLHDHSFPGALPGDQGKIEAEKASPQSNIWLLKEWIRVRDACFLGKWNHF